MTGATATLSTLRPRSRGLKAVTLYLPLVVGVALLAKGAIQLLWHPGTGYDLRLIWSVSQYYLHGINPFPVSFYHDDLLKGVAHGPLPAYLPQVGWPEQVDYPPSSTLTQVLVFGWPFAATRALYLALNIAGALGTAWWGAGLVPAGRAARFAVAGLVLANLGFSQTIINGNYGIIVIAALTGAWVVRGRHPALAGLLLGVALVKPTMSAPFVLLFLADGQYGALASCGVYLGASTVGTMAWTGTGLATLLRESLEGSARFARGGYGLWQTAKLLGANQPVALALNAAVFLVPLLVVLWRRRADLSAGAGRDLALLAAAGVVARLFTYHNSIDNVLLIFLVLALVERAMRGDEWAILLAGAVTLSLLVPFVLTDSVARHGALYVLWTGACAYVLAAPRVSETRARLG